MTEGPDPCPCLRTETHHQAGEGRPSWPWHEGLRTSTGMTQFSKLRPGTTDEGLRERSAIYPKGGGKGIAFLEDTLIGGAPRAGAAATGTTGRPRQYELLSTNGLCVLLVRGNSRRWRRDSRGTRQFDRGDTASTYGNDGITRITRATHATAYQRHTRTLKILALGQTSTGVTPPATLSELI